MNLKFVFIFLVALFIAVKCVNTKANEKTDESSSSSTEESESESQENNSEDQDDNPPEERKEDVDKRFTFWANKFGKFYHHTKKEKWSEKNRWHFEKANRHIREHNRRFKARKEAYQMDVNQFAGMSFEEIKNTSTGLIQMPDVVDNDLDGVTDEPGQQLLDDDDYPEEFNWNDEREDCVQPVINQGQCANCFACAALAALEWHYCLNTGKSVKLSEQQVTDCTIAKPYSNKGCGGGRVYTIFQYAADYKYLCKSKTDPFRTSSDQKKCAQSKCRKDSNFNIMKKPYYRKVASGDVTRMKEVIYNIGPVSIEMDAQHDFMYYKSGVYTGEQACSKNNRDHVMLVVGWGTDEETGIDYWIVRNSWSDLWGDDGYVYVQRGENVCGIEEAVRYPLMD